MRGVAVTKATSNSECSFNSSAKEDFPVKAPPGALTFRSAFTSRTLEITSNSLALPEIP